MPTAYDTIVLGCGTMGAATLLSLAKRGRRVVGFDRFSPPHRQGEHHGDVRMFRMSYYEHPSYVPWLRRSLKMWRELGEQYGSPLLELTGALYLGEPGSELISGCLRSAREHGLAHEQLDASEVARRFPMFRLPSSFVGIFERDAGFVRCEHAVHAMLKQAAWLGAEIHIDNPVTSWTAEDNRIHVAAVSEANAERLVITAGPWSSTLLSDLDINLTVTRQVQGWMVPPDPTPFLPDRFPSWAIDIGAGELFYGFPALPNHRGQPEVKVARHARGPVVDPESDCRMAQETDADDFLGLARQFLPDLEPARSSICLYTNSPDGHFIIDRHPKHSNVSFGAGFSGHGFKLAPAVGEILSGLAESKPPCHPEPFFSLTRLARASGGAA